MAEKSGMAEQSGNESAELRAEIESLKSDVSKLTDTIKRVSSERASQERERVRQTAEQSRQKASEAAGVVGQEIQQRPLTSLAAAFGVGFVLGKMLNR